MSGAHIVKVRNVNQALVDGLQWLCVAGHTADSRNGPVLAAPGPVITEYRNPTERVLFGAVRDANPFFHLYECVWMLAGRRDAASVAHYAKNMLRFADGDGTLNGAYGYRWRTRFGYEQLPLIIEELRRDPTSRRCVLTMWDPGAENPYPRSKVDRYTRGDLHKAMEGSPDVPCNTHVYFDAHTGQLDMTVCNRSNDAIWGAYGANAVHMSFLQEVVAGCAGLPVGTYYQVSNNLHVYVENDVAKRLLTSKEPGKYGVGNFDEDDRYVQQSLYPTPIGAEKYEDFVWMCEHAADRAEVLPPQASPWFASVFHPMMVAHDLYKTAQYTKAVEAVRECAAEDWRTAGEDWIVRRITAQESSV